MRRISGWIQRYSTGWVVLSSLILFLAFTAFVLPDQSSKARLATGSNSSPDTTFFYTSQDLLQFAQEYGEAGRAAYVKARYSFDILWPLVYTLFLAATISWLFRRIFKPSSPSQLSNLVPVYGMILDFLENISTSIVMIRYPGPSSEIAYMAPIFSVLKWFFVGAAFLLLMVGLVVYIGKRMVSKRD